MPAQITWKPREGFTIQVLWTLLTYTLLNPAFTSPILLFSRFTKQGRDLSIDHKTTFSGIGALWCLGLARSAVNLLNLGALNNWTKDEYNWNKEIVVITGGAGGIGGTVVQLLAEKGIKVVVLDIIPLTFEAASNVHYFKCDITSTAAIAATASKIRTQIGEPTILINNAGVARGKSLLDATESDLRFTFDVNTFSHYFLAKEFVPSMIANNHGMVVTVSSVAAFATLPNMVDYAASKAAAHSFHEGLTAELKTRYNAPRVRTVVVNPGYTKTLLFSGYDTGSKFLFPPLHPETVAEAIVKKVISGSSGQVILPLLGNIVTALRAVPHFVQLSTRADPKQMDGFHGRQVVDVEKDYRIKH